MSNKFGEIAARVMNETRNNSPPPPYSVTESSEPSVNPIFNTKVHQNPPDSGYHPQLNNNSLLPYTSNNQSINMTTQPAPVITQTVSARTASYGPFPVEMDCPYCQKHIVTHTNKVPGILTWIMFVICFVLGFILFIPWCFCCLPFCIDSCLDVLHNCPSCKRIIGKFSRL